MLARLKGKVNTNLYLRSKLLSYVTRFFRPVEWIPISSDNHEFGNDGGDAGDSTSDTSSDSSEDEGLESGQATGQEASDFNDIEEFLETEVKEEAFDDDLFKDVLKDDVKELEDVKTLRNHVQENAAPDGDKSTKAADTSNDSTHDDSFDLERLNDDSEDGEASEVDEAYFDDVSLLKKLQNLETSNNKHIFHFRIWKKTLRILMMMILTSLKKLCQRPLQPKRGEDDQRNKKIFCLPMKNTSPYLNTKCYLKKKLL